MRKIPLLLTCLAIWLVSLCVGAAAMAAANPRDVPPDHPAYQAVKKLLDSGYLQLYQDQTFQGDKPVDRYTLASIVARILNEIAAGQVGTNQKDVAVLRELTNEFQNELVDLRSKGDLSNRKLEDYSRQNQVFKEDLTQTAANVQVLSGNQEELKKEVQQLVLDIQGLTVKADAAADQDLQLKALVDQNTNNLSAATSDLAQTKTDLKLTRNNLDLTKGDLEQTKSVLKQTRDDLDSLKKDLAQTNANQKKERSAIDAMNANLDRVMNAVNQTGTASKDELDQTRAELAQTQAELKQLNARLEQAKSENDILRVKQQNQQTYLLAAIIMAVVGVVH